VLVRTHVNKAMGWLRLVGSLKLQVSFAKEPYKRDDILQQRPIILRSLLIVATPYKDICAYIHIYICISICKWRPFTCECCSKYICIYTHIHMYICIYVGTIHMWMRLQIYICICTCIHMYIYIYMEIVHVWMIRQVYIHMYTHTYVYMYIRGNHSHTYTHL